MLGCRCGAKWNAAEYLDQAMAAGCDVVTGARVDRVLIEDGQAVGVAGRRGRRRFALRAGTVVLAAGGIGSPRILQSSGLAHAGQNGLAMDTTLMVYGASRERGIAHEPPMTYGWTDHEHGYMLSSLIDPWLLYPLIMARAGVRHALSWHRWARTLGVMIKIKDNLSGGLLADGTIDKPTTPGDQQRIDHAIGRARQVLLNAGCAPDTIVPSPQRGTHPSATIRIGDMLDNDLATAGVLNLHVSDASVFPEALDAPTVLTIIALARRLADHLLTTAR
jgi:choline dehydrogenase-like flavoprotein